MDVLGEIEAVSLVYKLLHPVLNDEVLEQFPKINAITNSVGLRVNKLYHSKTTKDQFLRNLIGFVQLELPVEMVIKVMSRISTVDVSDSRPSVIIPCTSKVVPKSSKVFEESVFERESPNIYLSAKRNVIHHEEFLLEIKLFKNEQVQKAFKVQVGRTDRLYQLIVDNHLKTLHCFGGKTMLKRCNQTVKGRGYKKQHMPF
jgi:hypothetical protein